MIPSKKSFLSYLSYAETLNYKELFVKLVTTQHSERLHHPFQFCSEFGFSRNITLFFSFLFESVSLDRKILHNLSPIYPQRYL